MGLLDDAIRQHLELKRRHGAGEDEVRRQEQEALGPPRRGEVPQPLAPPGDDEGVAEEEVVTAAEAPTTAGAPVPEPDVVPSPPEQDEAWLDEPAHEPPPAAYAATSQPEAGDGDTDPGTDDVLEETPEFLQETPEHDRLWFEQKPPKDFDFDP